MPAGTSGLCRFSRTNRPQLGLVCCCGDVRCRRGQSVLDFPRDSSKPPLHIAGRTNEVVLELGFGQATVTRSPQSMGPDQFALCALNGVAMFHARFESVGLLLLPACLQDRMVLPDDQAPMPVLGFDAL